MTKAEQNAFKHAMSRHGEELGLSGFQETMADDFITQFNKVVGNIKSKGTLIGVQKKPYGLRGSGIPTQSVDANVYHYTDPSGKVFYYWEKLDGTFISSGLVK